MELCWQIRTNTTAEKEVFMWVCVSKASTCACIHCKKGFSNQFLAATMNSVAKRDRPPGACSPHLDRSFQMHLCYSNQPYLLDEN